MNTETLYRQYRSYFQTRRSGWRLGSDDGSRLLAQPFDGGGMHRLEAESAALELAAQLLRFTFARHDRPYLRRRIDEAADILRCEFSQTHTIATLTRRVGLNECYLKRCFKAQTGETVAASSCAASAWNTPAKCPNVATAYKQRWRSRATATQGISTKRSNGISAACPRV